MAAHPVRRGNGGRQRDLPGQHHPGDDLRQLVHLALAHTAQHGQTFLLCRQPRTAAVGGDDQRRDGDRQVEVPLRRQLGVDDPGRRLRHIGHVLPGGDEHGGDAVGRVQAVVVGSGENCAHVGDARVVVQALRLHPHVLDEHVALDGRLGHQPLAARAHHVHLRGLLVRGQVGFQIEVLDALVVVQNPAAGGEGRPADHVLPGRVAGAEVEAQVGEPGCRVIVDVLQPGHAGGGLRFFAHLVQIGLHPAHELARVAGIVEHEHRRALHRIADDRAGHPTRQVQDLHAPVVAGDQRAFGRGQGNDELTLGMLAFDVDRPGEPQRNLGHAAEVLGVAVGDVGVERIVVDVLQSGPGVILDEFLPGGNGLRAVVVGSVARNLHRLRLLFGDAVVDLQLQPAERLGLEADLDFVFSDGQRVDGGDDVKRAAQREVDGLGRQHFRRDLAAVLQHDRHSAQGNVLAVKLQPGETGQPGVAQPVLHRELHPLLRIFQTSERMQLLQQHAGNRQCHELPPSDDFRLSIARFAPDG